MKVRLPALPIALVGLLLAEPAVSAALRLETPVEREKPAAAEKKSGPKYFCPPCDSSCDKDEHDAPGSCPHCGMALVSKDELEKLRARQISESAARKRALILLFDGVQIIDFTGPYEVLGAAGFTVETVAEKAGPLVTHMGMKVTPTYDLAAAPTANVLVVPGGDVDDAQERPAIQKWLRERSEKAELVLSVCNGAFILAKAGLLDGLSATTTAGLIDLLRTTAPKTKVVSDKRYVDNGKIITAAGLSSGIDGALHVVERLYGKGTAQKVATGIEYDWDPTGTYVRAQLADRYLRDLYKRITGYEREIVLHEGTRNRWENRWTVKTDASAAELRAGLELQPTWTFTGDDGSTWRGVARVTGGPGKYDVTVRIERS